jgi:dihydrofolate reductase
MHSSTEFSPARNWIAVVAIARNGVIGNQGGLPWRLSSDLKRFKQLTMGHCLLMGRKTYESIGRPLPGRQTIVLSRSGFRAPVPNVACVASAEDVSALVEPGRKVMVVGGAQIYQATLPFCSEIWLTRVLADVAGDVHFPEVDWARWEQTSCEAIPSSESDQWPTEFQIYRRANRQDTHGPVIDVAHLCSQEGL